MRRPTIERLRDVLAYDPETGRLTWRVRMGQRGKVGAEAGSVTNLTAAHPTWKPHRVRYIKVDGACLLAHRIAWALHYGSWPADGLDVDHVNGDSLDNRIANLRAVTRAENLQNQRQAKNTNRTGRLGVTLFRGKYLAQIKVLGTKHFLGNFETAEEASRAYLAAKARLHPTAPLTNQSVRG